MIERIAASMLLPRPAISLLTLFLCLHIEEIIYPAHLFLRFMIRDALAMEVP